jgi:hypothetical protein
MMSEALSQILSNTEGLSPDDAENLSQGGLITRERPQLREQPRDVVNKVITPQVLESINRLYRLVDHRKDLISNTSVSFSIAQEMFTAMPMEDQSLPSRCTKVPSSLNVNAIIHLIEKNIQGSKEELSSVAFESAGVMGEKLSFLAETGVIKQSIGIIAAMYYTENKAIKKAISEPHIVYTVNKEFIRIDLEPLSNLTGIYNLIVGWNDKIGQFSQAVYDLGSCEDIKDVLSFMSLDAASTTIAAVIKRITEIGEKPELAEHNLMSVCTKMNAAVFTLTSKLHRKAVTIDDLNDYMHLHDECLPVINSALALLDKTKLDKFVRTITDLVCVLT